MYVGLYVEYPLFLLYFNETLNFHNRFSNSAQISNVMKIRQLRAELLDADTHMDRHDKALSLLPQFLNAPN